MYRRKTSGMRKWVDKKAAAAVRVMLDRERCGRSGQVDEKTVIDEV